MSGKYWKYKYNKEAKAYSVVSNDEIRIGAGQKSYVSVTEDGVVIAGGMPSKVMFNTMSPIYASFVRDTPYPLSMIPGPMSPPKQLPNIPLETILPVIKDIASMASAMAGAMSGVA